MDKVEPAKDDNSKTLTLKKTSEPETKKMSAEDVAKLLDVPEGGVEKKTDDEGNIPQEMCSYYERLIDNAVAVAMQGEISDFKSYVDPAQNVLSTRRMAVSCRIRPRGTLRYIIVNLGFENPAIKQ